MRRCVGVRAREAHAARSPRPSSAPSSRANCSTPASRAPASPGSRDAGRAGARRRTAGHVARRRQPAHSPAAGRRARSGRPGGADQRRRARRRRTHERARHLAPRTRSASSRSRHRRRVLGQRIADEGTDAELRSRARAPRRRTASPSRCPAVGIRGRRRSPAMKRGDRIAIWLPTPAWVELALAAKAGQRDGDRDQHPLPLRARCETSSTRRSDPPCLVRAMTTSRATCTIGRGERAARPPGGPRRPRRALDGLHVLRDDRRAEARRRTPSAAWTRTRRRWPESFGYRDGSCCASSRSAASSASAPYMGARRRARRYVLARPFRRRARARADRARGRDAHDRHRRDVHGASSSTPRTRCARPGFAAFNLDPPRRDAADERGITLYQCYGASEIQALVAHAPADAPAEERPARPAAPISDAIDVRHRRRRVQVKGPN